MQAVSKWENFISVGFYRVRFQSQASSPTWRNFLETEIYIEIFPSLQIFTSPNTFQIIFHSTFQKKKIEALNFYSSLQNYKATQILPIIRCFTFIHTVLFSPM